MRVNKVRLILPEEKTLKGVTISQDESTGMIMLTGTCTELDGFILMFDKPVVADGDVIFEGFNMGYFDLIRSDGTLKSPPSYTTYSSGITYYVETETNVTYVGIKLRIFANRNYSSSGKQGLVVTNPGVLYTTYISPSEEFSDNAVNLVKIAENMDSLPSGNANKYVTFLDNGSYNIKISSALSTRNYDIYFDKPITNAKYFTLFSTTLLENIFNMYLITSTGSLTINKTNQFQSISDYLPITGLRLRPKSNRNIDITIRLMAGESPRGYVAPKENTLEVQSRVYFSDLRIKNKSIMNEYQRLISQSRLNNTRYSEAASLLKGLKGTDNKGYLTDISFYGATLFNNIEERIVAIEEYLMSSDSVKPHLVDYMINKPESMTVGMHWISGIDPDDSEAMVGIDSTSQYENENNIDNTLGLIE